jgi:hypothetical protein
MPRTVSDDPDFLTGLIDTVAVESDANQTGGVRSTEGGISPNYQPVAGLEAEPCRVVFKKAANAPGDDRQVAVARGRVLFGSSVELDVNNRLVWSSRDSDRVRYLYIDGASRNAHSMSHHWIADFIEYIV